MPESELEMVDRNIRSGEDIVARQTNFVLTLRNHGRDSQNAEDRLTIFRRTLTGHYEHWAMLHRSATAKAGGVWRPLG
jgi:hypothetical protein